MTQLRSSFTTFIKAYKADQGFIGSIHESPLWEISEIKPDAAYLFNHVYEFFAHNSGKTELDRNQAVIYELRNNPETEEQKEAIRLWNTFFSREHTLKHKDYSLNFQLEKGSGVLSPTIIYVPLTGIALLIYSIRPGKNNQTLAELEMLNYHLRVSFKGAVAKIETGRRDHPQAQESEQAIDSALQMLNEYEQGDHNFTWSVNTLIDYLCSDIQSHITDLSPARLQAFVYVNLAEELEGAEFEKSFFRLRRMYSEKYVPAADFLEKGTEVVQTFEKIYYGASVEAAVVLVKDDKEIFLQNYESTVVQRTLWTYLLTFHQRMALISAAYDSNALYKDNSEPSTHQLSAIVERLTKLQLKGLFEEISHYSQQNDFYYLAYRNLRIEELFRELKEEVNEINLLLSDRWRQEEAMREREEEELTRMNQRKLEVLFALLIVPQIWFAVLSTNLDEWQKFFNMNEVLVNVINMIIWLVIISGIVRLFFLSSKKKKVPK